MPTPRKPFNKLERRSKITEDEFNAVITMYRGGVNRKAIATAMHLSISTIDSIKRCGTWEKYQEFLKQSREKYHRPKGNTQKEQLPGQMSVEDLPEIKKEETVIGNDLQCTAALSVCRIAEKVWELAYCIDKDAACDWMRNFLRIKEQ